MSKVSWTIRDDHVRKFVPKQSGLELPFSN